MQSSSFPPLMARDTAGEDFSFPSLLPNNRLKFLCSYGGKIVPRPMDGQLKYAGGHTRILTLPRSFSFSEFKERIEGMVQGRVAAIKYELATEGLDALVSITCDDDLAHMLEEYNRLEPAYPPPSAAGPASPFPRFRLYLFPSHSTASSVVTSPPSSTIDSPATTRPGTLSGGGRTQRVRSTPDLAGGLVGQHLQHASPDILLRRQRSSGSTAYCGGARPCSGGFGSWQALALQPAAGGALHSCGGCVGHADRPNSGGHQSRSGSPFRAKPRKRIVWW